jgi:hypothetical protein
VVPRERCRRSPEQHKKQQKEGRSFPISQRQHCPSQQFSEVKQRIIRELNHDRRQWQVRAIPAFKIKKKTKEMAALRGTPQQNKKQNIRNEAVPTMKEHKVSRNEQHETGRSVHAPTVNSLCVDNIFRVVSLVQQIMTDFSDAESEEDRTMATAKLVSYITTQHGHWNSQAP